MAWWNRRKKPTGQYSVEIGGFWNRVEQTNPPKKTKEPMTDEEKKKLISTGKFAASVIFLLVEFFIFVYIWNLLATQYQELLAPALTQIVNFLKMLGPIGVYLSQFVLPFLLGVGILLSVIVALPRMKGIGFESVKLIIYDWAWIMGIADIILFSIYVVLTFVPSDVILQLKCVIQNPSNAASCGGQKQPQAPTINKANNLYDVAVIKLGSAPKYEPPIIYQNQTYLLKANIENENPDKTLKDVYFSGFLDNGTCSETGDANKCIELAPSDYCMENDKCDVTTSKSATLESTIPIAYTSSFAEVNVHAYFSYSVTGEQKFWIYKNEEEGAKFVLEKPTSSEGPIDVGIDFTPDWQSLGAKATKVTALIYIDNKRTGVAYLNSITVKRTDELNALQASDQNCKTSWGTTFSEGDSVDLARKPLQKEFLFTCSYTLSSDYSFDSSYKTTTFDVNLDYQYKMSTEPQVVSIMQIP